MTYEHTFSSQGVRIFYAPQGVEYDDGETNGAGWYIQQMAVLKTDKGIKMPGISDGVGPYNTFEEAVQGIAGEFGKWEEPVEGDNQLSLELEPIPTPDQ